ncbi:MAG: two-component sensor histidine kinase [Gemmataceae bacterium]|nr:two-component sensor histidine kinase [Gemmataceae bacterium]
MKLETSIVDESRWDLDAEAIVVKIRWFGLLLGFAYGNLGPADADRLTWNAILSLGLVYTLFDTWFYRRHRVFLGEYPLVVSCMEALFIGLLCVFEDSLDSPFRYYYFLSLLCCTLRHTARVTVVTFLLHCISYGLVYAWVPHREGAVFSLLMLVVILGWVTWASSSLGQLLRRVGDRLSSLNSALRENQALLESRIEERTLELQETQAQLMHQDKMAGFGLLAAGIAHEVGNPLTSISTIVQVLERRDPDDYTRAKLALVGGQLARIQGIVRELTTFGRPASQERAWFLIHEIVEEALSIAKYYLGTKSRTILSQVPNNLPPLFGVRDQLVQVIFNLVLNAIDATTKGGTIEVTMSFVPGELEIAIRDNGTGIDPVHRPRIFRPYFTTKKQGTGLGLFVTQRIVREYGGDVAFDSEPGAGTTFRVRLPVPDPPALLDSR